jgi:hypothetical protein
MDNYHPSNSPSENRATDKRNWKKANHTSEIIRYDCQQDFPHLASVWHNTGMNFRVIHSFKLNPEAAWAK